MRMEIDDDENPSPEANAAGDVACAGDGGDARQHGAAPAEDDDGDEEARSIDDAEGDPGPDPLLLIHEQQLQNIKEPHSNDVLCGRGVTTNRFPGNCCFRALVGVNKELYVSSTKREKMKISRSIVQAVRSLDPPGRFLDKDPETGLWNDIGHKKAIEKTSQALRDGAATLRKQLSADLGDPDFLSSVFQDDDIEVEVEPTPSSGGATITTSSTSTGESKTSTTSAAAKQGNKTSSKTDTVENNQPKMKSAGSTDNSYSDRDCSTPKKPTTIRASEKKMNGNKVKTPPAKKGHHRRVDSNPSSLAQVIAADKARRRLKEREEEYRRYHRYHYPGGGTTKEGEPLDAERPPPSPGYHLYHHHHQMYPPTSPGPQPPPTPHPRLVRSLPNSPMSWGGVPPPRYAPDGTSPGPYPHHHHPAPHHYPPPPGYHHPSPPTFGYGRYGRSHSFDHPPPESPGGNVTGGPPPLRSGPSGPPPPREPDHSPRHHSWSPYGNQYSHHRNRPPTQPPTFSPGRPPSNHRNRTLPPLSPPGGPLSPAPESVRSPALPAHAEPTTSSSKSSTPHTHGSDNAKASSDHRLSPNVARANGDFVPKSSTSFGTADGASSKEVPAHHPTPEWSPRRVNYHPYGVGSEGALSSHRCSVSTTPPTPGRFYQYHRHPDEYTPDRSASWSHSPVHAVSHSPLVRGHRPHRPHSDHQRSRSFDGEDSDQGHGRSDDGLAVPSLGDEARRAREGRNVDHQSPRLHLAPRSRPFPHHTVLQTSSAFHASQGSPPQSLDDETDRLRREFIPPRFSHRSRRLPTSPSTSFHCSPVEEEKKMADVEAKEDVTMMPSCASGTTLRSRAESANSLNRNRSVVVMTEKGVYFDHRRISSRAAVLEEQEREEAVSPSPEDEMMEARASPCVMLAINKDGESIEAFMYRRDRNVASVGEARPEHVDGDDDFKSQQSNPEAECVDDIQMSPLQYGREDPVSLMALPDDIMTLPISPCGPHDEHGMTAS